MRFEMLKNLIFSLVLLESVSCIQGQSKAIDLDVQMENTIYLLDEPIYVQMKETNLSDRDQYLSYLNIEWQVFFSATLISSTGKVYKYNAGSADIDPFLPAVGLLLKPGESRYFVFQLNYYYGERDDRDLAFHDSYLPVGNYELQITHYTNANYVHEYFELQRKDTVDAVIDRKPVVGQSVSFSVIQTVGEQETERQDFLQAMHNYQVSRYPARDYIRAYSYLENFYHKYNDSPYLSTIVENSFFVDTEKLNITPFITLSEEFNRSKNNFSSFLLLIRAKQLYPDLKSDPRYDTPRKVAYERKALEFPGTLLGTYFSAEARDTQHALNQMQAVGKVEGTYSR